jgi:hypothetical protein
LDLNCSECNRLWEELADAIKIHLRIVGQGQLAGICQDSSLLRELEPILQAAAIRPGNGRIGFKEHAATHHNSGEQAMAATA